MYIKYPIIVLVASFIIGILLQQQFNFSLYWLCLDLLISLLILLVSYFYCKKNKTNRFGFVLSTIIAFSILGALHKYIHSDLNSKNHFSNYIQEANNLVVGTVTEKLKPSKSYNKYLIEVSQLNKTQTSGKVLLYLPKKTTINMMIGSEIQLFAKIDFINNITSPYQFNYTKYLNNQNIYHDIHANNQAKIRITKKQNWRFYIHFIKEKLMNSFNFLSLKEDNYNLLMALLFGERTTLSKEITSSYTNSGVIHILAISGLHIALFYGLLLWLTKPLKKIKHGETIIFILSLSVLWLYALITGMSASVVRAVVMFTVIAYGNLLNKQVNIYNSLATSIIVLLLWNPNYLFDIGFQLSYCAVIAIVSFQPIIYKYSYSKKWYIIKCKESLLITLVAQLGVLPLTLYYFGQFPILFLISNLIVIPLSSIILVLGLALIPLNIFTPTIAIYLSKIIEFLINSMNQFTLWISQFESLIVKNIAFHETLVFLLFGIICSLFFYLSNPKRKNLIWVLTSLLLFQMAYIILYITKKEESELIVFNTYKNTLIALKTKHAATFLSDDIEKNKTIISNYCRSNFINQTSNLPLKNTLYYTKRILCIDSNCIYKTKIRPEVIVLIQSPKINLNRLIETHHPEYIVADGSNYKSYIQLWKATCEKQKIPFHATTEKGLFQMK